MLAIVSCGSVPLCVKIVCVIGCWKIVVAGWRNCFFDFEKFVCVICISEIMFCLQVYACNSCNGS